MKRTLLLLLLWPALALGQTKPPDTFLDPTAAGPDFAVQGEYEGTVGDKDALAAQVIAEGKGRFKVVFLLGGLPGAGWDGKTRRAAVAQTVDGKTSVSGGGWKGTMADGRLSGTDPDGRTLSLRRVERKSPLEGLAPPPGALVLFDGKNVDAWTGTKLVEGNLLAQGATTKQTFRDFRLHVEFRLPFRPTARGQSRGNSGVYLQRRYEIQILDSFGLDPKNDDCAAVYELAAPSVNLCYPPLQWQTYDIEFTAARFGPDGKKTAPAVVTVVHNGVKVHDKRTIPGPTGFGEKEADTPMALYLQNHGNPVVFRNVWLVEKKE
jgi:hypothetical protein